MMDFILEAWVSSSIERVKLRWMLGKGKPWQPGEKLKLLVPGIRPAGGRRDDQKRTVTAAEAANAGANYIVLGRMITEAKDPASELRSVMATL